jgi:copper transport protein
LAFGPLLVVLAAVLVLAGASPAAAHASLVDSTPSPSAVLAEPPPAVVLHFDEEVDVALGGIEVVRADGTAVDVGAAEQVPGDRTRVRAALPDLDDGTYVVAWRVTSADGHPAKGAFSFQLGVGAAADTSNLAASLLAAGSGSGGMRAVVGVARWLGFAAFALLVGAAAFCALAWPAGAARWPVRRLAWWGWGLGVVAAVASFVLHGPYVAGRPVGDAVDSALWGDVAGTRFGQAMLLRVALLAAALPLLVELRRCRSAAWRGAAAVVVVGLGLSFAVSGHPSTGRWSGLGVLADTAHVVAMALWLGGLAVLALVALVGGRPARHEPPAEPDRTDGVDQPGAGVSGPDVVAAPLSVGAAAAPPAVADDVTRAVQRFSALAFGAVAVLVATGVFQAWRLLGGIDGIGDSSYGRLLVAKTALVALVVLLAAISRRIVRRYWPARAELRRTVVSELVVGVCILAVTAVLVGTSPAAGSTSVFATSLVRGDVIADLSIEPAAVGTGELHLYVALPGGSLARVEDATARLTLPARDLGPVPVALETAGPNHYLGALQFPYPGDWELELLVTTAPGRQVRFTTTVPVSG